LSAILGAALAITLPACGAKTATPTETGNPPFADVDRIRLGLKGNMATLTGLPGAVPGGAQVNFRNITAQVAVQVTASQEGAFEVVVAGTISDEYALDVSTNAGASKVQLPIPSVVADGSSAQVPPNDSQTSIVRLPAPSPAAQIEANSPLGPRLFEPQSNSLVSPVTDEESALLCSWEVNTRSDWHRDMACVSVAAPDGGTIDCSTLAESEGIALARRGVCQALLKTAKECGPIAVPVTANSQGSSGACCWLFEYVCLDDVI
jgi:hypothetical protein